METTKHLFDEQQQEDMEQDLLFCHECQEEEMEHLLRDMYEHNSKEDIKAIGTGREHGMDGAFNPDKGGSSGAEADYGAHEDEGGCAALDEEGVGYEWRLPF